MGRGRVEDKCQLLQFDLHLRQSKHSIAERSSLPRRPQASYEMATRLQRVALSASASPKRSLSQSRRFISRKAIRRFRRLRSRAISPWSTQEGKATATIGGSIILAMKVWCGG